MFSRMLLSIICVALFGVGITGCSTAPTRQQVGIGTGAVVGGVLGNVLTEGSTLGTVGGAAVGGVVGNEVSKKK
jgi:osmotically inducible lipoprotein OsmB